MPRRIRYIATRATRFADPAFRFGAYHSDNRTATIRYHSHEFMELEFVVRGAGVYVDADAEYPMIAGDVFVIAANGAHGYRDRDKCETANIQFDPEQFLPHDSDIAATPSYHALFELEPRYRTLHKFHSRLHLDTQDTVLADRLITALEREGIQKAPGYQTAIRGLFMQLVVLLCRAYAASTEPSAQMLLRVGPAIRHIDLHCSDHMSLPSLARMCSLSVNQFLRVFKEATGHSPMEHVMHQRINRAARLLEHDDDTITHIAHELGFADSSHFCRCFKQLMGNTPRVWRQRARAR